MINWNLVSACYILQYVQCGKPVENIQNGHRKYYLQDETPNIGTDYIENIRSWRPYLDPKLPSGFQKDMRRRRNKLRKIHVSISILHQKDDKGRKFVEDDNCIQKMWWERRTVEFIRYSCKLPPSKVQDRWSNLRNGWRDQWIYENTVNVSYGVLKGVAVQGTEMRLVVLGRTTEGNFYLRPT